MVMERMGIHRASYKMDDFGHCVIKLKILICKVPFYFGVCLLPLRYNRVSNQILMVALHLI